MANMATDADEPAKLYRESIYQYFNFDALDEAEEQQTRANAAAAPAQMAAAPQMAAPRQSETVVDTRLIGKPKRFPGRDEGEWIPVGERGAAVATCTLLSARG